MLEQMLLQLNPSQAMALGLVARGTEIYGDFSNGRSDEGAAKVAFDVLLVAAFRRGGAVEGGSKLDEIATRFFGGKCSFTPSTAVLMADGETESISDIKAGEKVEAADPDTGKHEGPRRVDATLVNHDYDLVDLKIERADGSTGTLHTTAKHPYWDDTLHSWVPAGQLREGYALNTASDHHVHVAKVTARPGDGDMYNLTVDDLHTYYVLAGETPVLVHNSQCTTLPSSSTDDFAVIGRKSDVNVAREWEGHEVLDLPRWSIEQNDRWIKGVIDSRQKVYVSSPERGNLRTPGGRETVFARELRQLRDAGYTRDGDYMLPPG
ncbi:polymorphic toxin-type HINT domain-containing protein [Streptomyces sp. MS06]|uniref:polymorphic toxin-type HINT domain-containing protein n=1 Tax=Streptomyces sp. MS06 TaxID=3385974 RepID=UPI0039A22AE7